MVLRYILSIVIASLLFADVSSAAQITGFVKAQQTGAAIANAQIKAIAFGNNTGDSLVLHAVTGPDGRYMLPIPGAMMVTLYAYKEGYQMQQRGPLSVGDTLYTINFELAPLNPTPNLSTVNGKIYKKTAGTLLPLAGATIKLTGNNANLFFVTYSDSNGYYKFINVPYGTYASTCTAPGYTMVNQTITVSSAIVTQNYALYSGNSTGNSISGKTIDDIANLPLAGVSITVKNIVNPGQIFTTVSLTSGEFRFASVPSGTYTLTAQKEGYEPFSLSQPIQLDSGVSVNNLILYLHKVISNQTSTVKGKVYKNSANVLIPVPGAIVTLSGEVPGFTVTAVSDSFGNFSIPQVPYGQYSVTCIAAGLQPVTLSLVVQLPVTELVLKLNGQAPIGTIISGYVKDDSTRQPLGGVHLLLKPSGILPYLLTVTSNEAGYFSFANVPNGSYNLSAEKPGYLPYIHAEPIQVNDSLLNLQLLILMRKSTATGSAKLSGVVYNKFSTVPQPIPNAMVKLLGTNSGTAFSAITDSNGRYTITNIPFGNYAATCAAEGFIAVTTQITLQSLAQEFPFYLMPSTNPGASSVIFGRVTFDGASTPVKGAKIEFIPTNLGGFSFSAITDAEGRYIGRVLPGSYYAACRYENSTGYMYKEYFDNVQTIADATVLTIAETDTIPGVDFGIPVVPSGNMHTVAVSGFVRNTNNVPLTNAKVSVVFVYFNSTVAYTALTNADGKYNINFSLNGLDSLRNVIAVMAVKEQHKMEFFNEKSSLTLADKLTIYSDTVFTNINFTLEPVAATTFSISGTVTGAQQQPIAGGFVIAVNSQTSEIAFSMTDINGLFQLGNVKQGKFFLMFAAAGYVPEFFDNALTWEQATPIIVNAPVNNIAVNLLSLLTPFSQANSVMGIIRDQSGNAVDGAMVMLKDQDANVVSYAFSNADGSYSLAGVQNGTNVVQASKVAFQSYQQSFQFSTLNGTTMLHNIVLAPGGNLSSDQEMNSAPASMELAQNFPNPFNPSTTITYQVGIASLVRIQIYDVLGNEVQLLVNRFHAPGSYHINFVGENLQSGVYVYRMTDGTGKSYSRKMLLLK